jgi:hypothetical protein
MAESGLPLAAQLVVNSYDPASGCYRREDGSLDPCPTEVETLGVLESNGNEDARIYSIDPWDIPHFWENSSLEKYISFLESGPVSMGCTIARKIRNGSLITQDPAWLMCRKRSRWVLLRFSEADYGGFGSITERAGAARAVKDPLKQGDLFRPTCKRETTFCEYSSW